MMYGHFCEPNGDSIMKNLFAIKKRMGGKWSANMAAYAIRKSWNITPLKWRERVSGMEYQHIQFTEV